MEHNHPIFGAVKIRMHLPRDEWEDGQRRCATSKFRGRGTCFELRYSLMIRERVPAHTTFENRGRVRVFCHRAEVEHPIVLSVASIQKPLRVFAFVSVKAFYTGRRVTHNNYPIREVDEILDVNPDEVPQMLRVLEMVSWWKAHLARGPTFHP